jgi:hypothetical protein
MSSRGRSPAGLAKTVALALAVCVAVVGICLGLQRAVLAEPAAAELQAARVEGAMILYRYVTATIHLPGRRVLASECLEGWLPRVDGHAASRGAEVIFSDGERLREARGAASTRFALLGGPQGRVPFTTQVVLAGCSRTVADRLSLALIGDTPTSAVPALFRGRRVLELHVQTRYSDFRLFADPTTKLPVAVEAGGGWSSIRSVRLTPALLSDFRRRFDGG